MRDARPCAGHRGAERPRSGARGRERDHVLEIVETVVYVVRVVGVFARARRPWRPRQRSALVVCRTDRGRAVARAHERARNRSGDGRHGERDRGCQREETHEGPVVRRGGGAVKSSACRVNPHTCRGPRQPTSARRAATRNDALVRLTTPCLAPRPHRARARCGARVRPREARHGRCRSPAGTPSAPRRGPSSPRGSRSGSGSRPPPRRAS